MGRARTLRADEVSTALGWLRRTLMADAEGAPRRWFTSAQAQRELIKGLPAVEASAGERGYAAALPDLLELLGFARAFTPGAKDNPRLSSEGWKAMKLAIRQARARSKRDSVTLEVPRELRDQLQELADAREQTLLELLQSVVQQPDLFGNVARGS